jgi:hypothetical protein
MMENLLQREAPAHVLLRILWLTPKDLCAFESYYRQWRYWLTSDQSCRMEYHPCDFQTYLFTTLFQCPADCTECPPCPDQAPPVNPCFADPCDQVKKIGPFTVVEQVNKIFCWAGLACGEKVVAQPVAVSGVGTVGGGGPVGAGPAGVVDEAIVDQRFTRYRDGVRLILEASGNEIAGQALAFLQTQPNGEEYAQVIDRIIRNESTGREQHELSEGRQHAPSGTGQPEPSGETKLTRAQQGILAAAVTYYYLDNLIFQYKEGELTATLQPAVAALQEAGIGVDRELWNEDEVKKARTNIDLRKVHQLLK